MTDATAVSLSKLLVPLDESERSAEALPYALALLDGAGPGASLTVLHVVPDAEPLRKPLGQILKTAEEMLAELTADAQALLQRAVAGSGAAEAGVPVDPVVRFGYIADTVLEVADELAVDAVVMASSGRGLLSRLALGSVADKVARESGRPTLVVREHEAPARGEGGPAARPTIRRIVVPLDGSGLARGALPMAATLAARLSVPVALVTVVEPVAGMGVAGMSSAGIGGAAFSPDLYGDMQEQIEAAGREQLAEVERDLAAAGVQTSSNLLHGTAAGAIIAFAAPTDLIVMTSRGHGGFKRAVLGSVADVIVREGPAPVFIVPVLGDETG